MRPGSLIHYPPRLWEVGIVRIAGRTRVACRTCGPLDRIGSPHEALRAGMLGHLARHARCDVTPTHLRTCQCGRHGCRWHRRHRGCAGAVVLALTHRSHSPTWQLADTCRDCCAAMPSTATVPEPSPGLAAAPGLPPPAETLPPTWFDSPGTLSWLHEDGEHAQVWETTETW